MNHGIETKEGLEQLQQLEDKVRSVARALQAARSGKEELAREVAHYKKRASELDQLVRPLQDRVAHLEKERNLIQSRLEKVLEQVDSLLQAGLEAS